MLPTLDFLITSDYASTSVDGKLSMAGVFTQIKTPEGKKSEVVTFYISGRIRNVPQVAAFAMVKLFNPDGSLNTQVKVLGAKVPLSGILAIKARFNLVEFIEKGKYKIKVFIDDDTEVVGPPNAEILVI